MVLEKPLESPLDCREIQLVNPKGNQSWIFIGRTDTEAEAPIFWTPDVKNWLIEKDPNPGKDWRQEEKEVADGEMVGWHHWLNGHEFEQTVGDSEGQRSLRTMKSWTQVSDWTTTTLHYWGFPDGPGVKILPENAGDSRDACLILGLERSPRVGNGDPLQYSCLENSMYRRAWWATVRGVTRSWTWLSWTKGTRALFYCLLLGLLPAWRFHNSTTGTKGVRFACFCTVWAQSLLEGLKISSFDCCCLVAQSCLTHCDPMDCSPPGFSVQGFSRQEY